MKYLFSYQGVLDSLGINLHLKRQLVVFFFDLRQACLLLGVKLCNNLI
jgi:hypothetical protein